MVNERSLLVLYFFYNSSLGEKNILPNLTTSQEPELYAFDPLEPEPLEKKIYRAEAALEKNQEPELLGKSQEPEQLKN